MPLVEQSAPPSCAVAEEYGSRTHQGLLATPTRFEVWPAHRGATPFLRMQIPAGECTEARERPPDFSAMDFPDAGDARHAPAA